MKRLCVCALLGLVMAGATAQGTVYRCPGNPVLYTDQITEREAKERGCRTIEGAAVTVVQVPKPKAPAAASVPNAASRPGETRVDPAAQKARDTDAKQIGRASCRERV